MPAMLPPIGQTGVDPRRGRSAGDRDDHRGADVQGVVVVLGGVVDAAGTVAELHPVGTVSEARNDVGAVGRRSGAGDTAGATRRERRRADASQGGPAGVGDDRARDGTAGCDDGWAGRLDGDLRRRRGRLGSTPRNDGASSDACAATSVVVSTPGATSSAVAPPARTCARTAGCTTSDAATVKVTRQSATNGPKEPRR